MLLVERPCGSVNINEGVSKVLAAVSHSGRHRKWYCRTSLLTDALVRVSFWDALVWITDHLSKNRFAVFAACLHLWKCELTVKVHSPFMSFVIGDTALIINAVGYWIVEMSLYTGCGTLLRAVHASSWLWVFWFLAGTHVGGTHNQWLSASGCLDKDCGFRFSMLQTLWFTLKMMWFLHNPSV